MRKLIFVLLTFLAVFTFIRAADDSETGEKSFSSVETLNYHGNFTIE